MWCSLWLSSSNIKMDYIPLIYMFNELGPNIEQQQLYQPWDVS